MKNALQMNVISLISGILFGLGLGVGGMLNPANVIGFLDVFGSWNGALMGVMAGGIIVMTLANQIAIRKERPLFALDWSHLPNIGSDLSGSARVGSALFGMGWGITGFCPGPALVSLVSLNRQVVVFTVAMLVGFVLHDRVIRRVLQKHH